MRTADDTTDELHTTVANEDDPTEPHDDPMGLHTTTVVNGKEVRPVRALIPTERRGDFYVSLQDTMLAASLGITRHTADDELDHIANGNTYPGATAAQFLTQITAIRNGLAIPRDVDEAREWGFVLPITEHENHEETDDDENKRLGWWWGYDLTRFETREQRRERYLADQRRVDTKGLARLFCRKYGTVSKLKVNTDTARKVIADTGDARARAAARFRSEKPGYTGSDAQLIPLLIAAAHRTVLRGTPQTVDKAGQSGLFLVCDGLKTGRTTKKLNEWYCYTKGYSTGRPSGSSTRYWGKRGK